MNFTLEHFETNPDNKNPHVFTGTTDAGEKISWNGFFYLDPLRSWGELTLENLPLNKYAPLYQDQVPFEIRDGFVGVDVNYRLEISATNRIMAVTNTSFTLRDFKLAEPDSETNMVELSRFAVTGVNVDAVARQAEIGLVSADGGKFFLLRKRNDSTNVAVAVHFPTGGSRHERAGRHPGVAGFHHQRRRPAPQQHQSLDRHRPRRGVHQLRLQPRRPGQFPPGPAGPQ